MKLTKYILGAFLLLMLWFPLLQTVFLVIESGPLKGAFVVHNKPELNDSTWFEGSFQREYELYFNDTVGFHQDFIRLRNQTDFSLFKKCHSYDIEVGNNGYLIATTHIDAHLGKTYVRESIIDTNVLMLKQLNDTLIKKNKTLVILFAPCRGAFYKELTPYWYDLKKEHESDYERYIRLLSKTNIKVIDYNKWFLQMKSTAKHALFTKCGIHWSLYGATVAADSLINFIESERDIDLPDIKIDTIELSTVARDEDADLNRTLNLIWPVANDIMAYPKLSFKKKGRAKINAMVIGDSFFFNVCATMIPTEVFNEFSFWYYNSTIYSTGKNDKKNANQVNMMTEINRHDVIGLICTESTLGNFGWGFIKQAYDLYCGPQSNQINYYIEQIKKDSVWLGYSIKKAKETNKDLQQQLKDDAQYAIWMESQKK